MHCRVGLCTDNHKHTCTSMPSSLQDLRLVHNMTLVQRNVRTVTLRSFVNVITSYRSDPIGASGASAGVDLSSTLAEPA